MDKYTKFILTVIVVALIGILFKGEIIKPAYASSVEQVCVAGHRFVVTSQGGIVQFKGAGKGSPALCN